MKLEVQNWRYCDWICIYRIGFSMKIGGTIELNWLENGDSCRSALTKNLHTIGFNLKN